MSAQKPYRLHILVCNDSDCTAKGSQLLYEGFKRIVKERSLKDEVKVSKSTCLSDCSIGPNVVVYHEGVLYNGVSEKDLETIINAHLKGKTASKLRNRKFLE